ncbi:MAG: cytochrome P450 [Alphaproteobacteria bacterium]|nr:cytochrome P450 [Alphaproteobacteria bacterium]
MTENFVPVGAPVHRRVMSRIETALAARRNVLEVIPIPAYRQPIVSGEMLSRWHMLADPAGYRRVMSENLANYPKSEIMRRMLRPAIGDSLFNADGADWRWQRRAVAPVFTHRNVVALAPAMTATAERAAARLEASGGRAEMVHEMLTATFDVICDVALSGREHFDARAFGAAITRYFQTAGRASLLDFLGVPDWFPRPGEILAGGSVKTMHDMVAAAIQARRQMGRAGADDLLDYMLAAEDPETGQRMSAEDLVFNMQFFIVAGHETTALALAWALYLLANSPAEQAAVRAQARAQLGSRAATAADLEAMPLVTQVLEETMRLYPPVGLLARAVLEEDELCGRVMKPGDILFLPIWALHRHEMWWEQPELFRPARFGADVRRDKYQYLPFGAGPRVCVGANFAMMQAGIILSTLLARFSFAPAGPGPRPIMSMTVRPDPGVTLAVKVVG